MIIGDFPLRCNFACCKIFCPVLRGALAARQERKGELEQRQFEMLIGGDDISNDLSRVFQCLFTIHSRFRFALIGGNVTVQPTGSHRGTGSGIQIPEP